MTTKQQIFEYLVSAHGRWVTGEELGELFSISRAGIWKSITSLRNEGFSIEALPNKGYLFSADKDMMIPSLIAHQLNSKVIGKGDIICLDEIDSTNTYGKNLAGKNYPEGTVIIAQHQNAGKGRLGRRWHSAGAGSLYCSFIIRPQCTPAEISGITLLATLATYKTISLYIGDKTQLKWPNDILIGAKKIAGILTEIDASPDQVHYAIVGIGINIGNTIDSFPNEIREKATSLLIETGTRIGKREFLCRLIESLDYEYQTFVSQGFSPTITQWKDVCPIIGKTITITRHNELIHGTVRDLDVDGALIIDDSTGKSIRIYSGDICL